MSFYYNIFINEIIYVWLVLDMIQDFCLDNNYFWNNDNHNLMSVHVLIKDVFSKMINSKYDNLFKTIDEKKSAYGSIRPLMIEVMIRYLVYKPFDQTLLADIADNLATLDRYFQSESNLRFDVVHALRIFLKENVQYQPKMHSLSDKLLTIFQAPSLYPNYSAYIAEKETGQTQPRLLVFTAPTIAPITTIAPRSTSL
jgi:hypothetical protein